MDAIVIVALVAVALFAAAIFAVAYFTGKQNYSGLDFSPLLAVVNPPLAYLASLWRFWGPRLTDRGFVGAIFANTAVLASIDPEKAELWQLAVWGAANLFFPLWDNQPAGETLTRKPVDPELLTVDHASIDDHLERTLDRVIQKYAEGRS